MAGGMRWKQLRICSYRNIKNNSVTTLISSLLLYNPRLKQCIEKMHFYTLLFKHFFVLDTLLYYFLQSELVCYVFLLGARAWYQY